MSTELRPCPGYEVLVPEIDGPTHRYIGASAGCWAAYGKLLEKEAGDFRADLFYDAHGLVPRTSPSPMNGPSTS
jgi:hypothetical protein